MKVSIITATYNSANTIGECMTSVLQQDYPHIEYLIKDGASSDDTLTIVNAQAAKDRRIKVVSDSDTGIYDALNKGLAEATGDLIGFVHSDDVLASIDVISKIVATIRTHKADGVYGDLHYIAANPPHKVIRNWVSQPFRQELLVQGWMPPHPTLYLKSSIYEDCGHFNTDYKIAADYEFMLRVLKEPHYNFYYLPKTLIKMRVGGASNRNISNILQKSKEDFRAMRQHNTGNFWTLVRKNISKVKQFF